jgi:hypothetical protein
MFSFISDKRGDRKRPTQVFRAGQEQDEPWGCAAWTATESFDRKFRQAHDPFVSCDCAVFARRTVWPVIPPEPIEAGAVWAYGIGSEARFRPSDSSSGTLLKAEGVA